MIAKGLLTTSITGAVRKCQEYSEANVNFNQSVNCVALQNLGCSLMKPFFPSFLDVSSTGDDIFRFILINQQEKLHEPRKAKRYNMIW